MNRSLNGRFQPGTDPGPGNPYSKYQEVFRSLLYKCVNKKKYKELIKRVYTDAMAGNTSAQKLLLGRLLGKEVQQIHLDMPLKLYQVGTPVDDV